MRAQSRLRVLLATSIVLIAVAFWAVRLLQSEKVLQDTLEIMRAAIGHYTVEHRREPANLSDLVQAGYFRYLPEDPITGRSDKWVVIREAGSSGGITDVRSGSHRRSTRWTRYDTW
jgi:competence protein ComGC